MHPSSSQPAASPPLLHLTVRAHILSIFERRRPPFLRRLGRSRNPTSSLDANRPLLAACAHIHVQCKSTRKVPLPISQPNQEQGKQTPNHFVILWGKDCSRYRASLYRSACEYDRPWSRHLMNAVADTSATAFNSQC